MSPNLLELSCQDMLFAHWPVEVDALRPYVPQSLEIDTYDGSAWIGAVAFRVQSIHTLGSGASVPLVTPFLNLNVRTYVEKNSRSGIFFLSSDIESSAAATIGRRLFGFAVYRAQMNQRRTGQQVRFRSERADKDQRKAFQAQYEPVGDIFHPESGSIEDALIEQSRYYIAGEPTRNSAKSLQRGDDRSVQAGEISQPVHQLRSADVDIQVNTLLDNFEDGLLDDEPVVHYCNRWDAGWNPIESTG